MGENGRGRRGGEGTNLPSPNPGSAAVVELLSGTNYVGIGLLLSHSLRITHFRCATAAGCFCRKFSTFY